MTRRPKALAALPLLALLACAGDGSGAWLDRARSAAGALAGSGALSETEIASGLREALRVATRRTVDEVGVEGGYADDPAIHIPLPETLARVQEALRPVGLSGMADELELRLNRAAEAAAPEAQEVFVSAIREMTWADARRILEGPDDAATQYLRETMSDPLKQRMRPLVNEELAQVGALRAYRDMMGEYEALPLVPDVQANLTDYTLGKALDGLFHYLAKEEARIREDPAARTSEILQRVFASS